MLLEPSLTFLSYEFTKINNFIFKLYQMNTPIFICISIEESRITERKCSLLQYDITFLV